MTRRSHPAIPDTSPVARYLNPWFRGASGGDTRIYETSARPVGFRGFLIYRRIQGSCWDVVKDRVCIGQYANLGGAPGSVIH